MYIIKRGHAIFTYIWRGGRATEDVDERRPPDIQLGRCQGHTPMVKPLESLNSLGLFLTQSQP